MIKKITSEKWILIKQDLLKVGKGLLIALAGALATWLETDLLKVIDFSIFGAYAMYAITIVTAVNSGLVNLIRKWISKNEY